MKNVTPFASNSLAEHLLRGVVGITALVFAFKLSGTHGAIALALGVLTLIAFRGCPMCWTIGLCETLRNFLINKR